VTHYVLGIDPPNGVAAWARDGVVMWRQTTTGSFREQRVQVWRDAITLINELGPPLVVAIEKPYGAPMAQAGLVDSGLIEALLKQADSGGWLEAKFQGCDITRPIAMEWRAAIGVAGGSRKKVNDRVVRLAEKAVIETSGKPLRGPRDGAMEHAANAVGLAMATWALTGLWKKDSADAFARWKQTGLFGDKRPKEDTDGTAESEGRDTDRVQDDGHAAVGKEEAGR
jgi:hypothetical protein